MNFVGTFTAPGNVSGIVSLGARESVKIILTFTGAAAWRVDLEEMSKGDAGFRRLASYSADTTGLFVLNDTDRTQRLRLRCVTLTDTETIDYILRDVVEAVETVAGAAAAVTELVAAGAGAKAGTTAGWVVGAGNNLGKLATLPLNKTASTLVVPLPPLRVGQYITGAYLVGSLQGTTAKHTTVLLDIRSLTAAAAGATDASIGVMSAALDVVADTIVSRTNTRITGINHAVARGESFYALITATTANDALCTAELQAVVLEVAG